MKRCLQFRRKTTKTKSDMFFVVILLWQSSVIHGQIDPCLPGEDLRSIYRQQYRGTKCKFRSGRATSDQHLTEGWYKVNTNESNSLLMPTVPPNLTYCSSLFPVWMNGSHPVLDDQVNRTACIVHQTSNCVEEIQIKVKNCGSFMAYYLLPTLYANTAYCFGQDKECPPPDPCEDIDREGDIFDDGNRSPFCSLPTPQHGCDNGLTGDWHRLYDLSERKTLTITRTCPSSQACGTTNPIWINGSEPTIQDGEIELQACVRGLHCCDEDFQIMVKNCTSFLVYKLPAVTSCPQRFCFGNRLGCSVTSTSTPTSTSQSSNPEYIAKPANKNILTTDQAILIGCLIGAVFATVITIVVLRFLLKRKRPATKIQGFPLKE